MKFEPECRWNAVKHATKAVASSAVAVAMTCTFMLGAAGCSSQAQKESQPSAQASASTQSESVAADASDDAVVTTEIDESRYKLDYTDRDSDPSYEAAEAASIELAGSSAASESADVEVNGSDVTIGAAGVYVLSGSLDDGQVIVNAPEDSKVQLVLNGAEIANSNGSALYVQQADKCFVTLAEGTQNSLADGASYDLEGDSDEPDATLYATCDLTLQGSGSLAVTGNYNDAVKTKDDLVVTGGTYEVSAKADGLVGKDSVKVADGTISVSASEGDGIKSSKDDDESKGFVSIDGGTVAINAGDKGVKAETYLRVAGGTLDVTSANDALHCDGCGRMSGGDVKLAAGDDGFHVEYALEVNGGTIDVSKSYEGLEGQTITINDGNVRVVASDDGFNAATANAGSDEAGFSSASDGDSHWNMMRGGAGQAPEMPDASMQEGEPGQGRAPEPPSGSAEGEAPSGQAPGGQMPNGQAPSEQGPSGQGASSSSSAGASDAGQMQEGFGGRGGGMGGGMMESDENCVITINGGTVEVDAGGDGIDSNGPIIMNGGTVYVSGPTSNGDGALDCGTTITANGGTLIAAGSSGMAEGFTDGTQAFGQVNLEGAAGDTIEIADSTGAVIASYTPTKAFQNVVVTAPGMEEGATYTATAGSAKAEFTASTEGTSAGFGGFGGQMPGNAANDRQMPDGAEGGRQMPGGNGNGAQGGPRGMHGPQGSSSAEMSSSAVSA